MRVPSRELATRRTRKGSRAVVRTYVYVYVKYTSHVIRGCILDFKAIVKPYLSLPGAAERATERRAVNDLHESTVRL